MGVGVLGPTNSGRVCQTRSQQGSEQTETRKVVKAAMCTLAVLALASGAYLAITLKQLYNLRFGKVSVEDLGKEMSRKTEYFWMGTVVGIFCTLNAFLRLYVYEPIVPTVPLQFLAMVL